MRMTLMMIESSYRGAVEGQYTHSIWYAQAHGRMGDIADVLLLGDSYLYARKGQNTVTLESGGISLPKVYDFEPAITALMKTGAQVYVTELDHRRHGGGDDALIDGVRILDDEEVLDVIEDHQHLVYC